MTSQPDRNRQPHGRMVDCPGGYRAYVPAPAPPPLEWSESLTLSLSSADRAIGRLAGEGRRLPNPHILIRPFVRREAVLSSRIEGTQATLGELLAAQAGAVVERNPDDLHEVGNYVTALEYGLERLETLPVSLRLVRELHERLMRGVRGEVATPGRVPTQPELDRAAREHAERGDLCPSATLGTHAVSRCLGAVPARRDAAAARARGHRPLPVRGHPPLPRRERARRAPAHHPAAGRAGRHPLPAALPERLVPGHARGVLRAPQRRHGAGRVGGVADLLPERRRTPVRRRGGPHRASRRPALRLEGASWPAAGPELPERALDLFAENPFWTVGGVADRLEVAFTTAQRTIARLEAAGIVAQLGEARRNRVYCAGAVLDVLEEPSPLAG